MHSYLNFTKVSIQNFLKTCLTILKRYLSLNMFVCVTEKQVIRLFNAMFFSIVY